MAEHKLDIDDKAEAQETQEAQVVERHPYKVLSEAGLFKNGKQINQGETVYLDVKTAVAAMNAGDVEPIDEAGEK